MQKLLFIILFMAASFVAKSQNIDVYNNSSQTIFVTLYVFNGGPVDVASPLTISPSNSYSASVAAFWGTYGSGPLATGAYVVAADITGQNCSEVANVSINQPDFVSCSGSADELTEKFNFTFSTKDVIITVD